MGRLGGLTSGCSCGSGNIGRSNSYCRRKRRIRKRMNKIKSTNMKGREAKAGRGGPEVTTGCRDDKQC